jgi:hypothetical protein
MVMNRVMMQLMNVAVKNSHRFLYLQHNRKVFASAGKILSTIEISNDFFGKCLCSAGAIR